MAAVLMASAPAAAQTSENGSSGMGDPFFPLAGNGGYDVSHYSLTLDYKPAVRLLEGTAVVEATATQNLRRFNLDFRDFYDVSSVEVNGRPAKFRFAQGQELVIDP